MYAREVNNMCHYATDEEIDWMVNYGMYLKDRDVVDTVVMLGAGPGVLLLALKEYFREAKAVVVDHTRCDYVKSYLKDMNALYNVSLIVDDSIKVGKSWKQGLIKLLIIDTDHTEHTTREEIHAWTKHVTKDGTIFFHDYDAVGTWFEKQEQYPGVKIACDDLMPQYGWIMMNRVGTAAIYKYVG